MRVEVFYFEGCPNHQPAVDLVNDTLSKLGLSVDVVEVEIADIADVDRHRFLGSPSLRVDGIDIEAARRTDTVYSYACRTYNGAGLPSPEMLEAAILGNGDRYDGTAAASTNAANCCSDAPAEDVSPQQSQSSSRWLSLGSVGAAAVASACCWLPLTLVAFGMTTGGLAAFFESTRPVFLAVTAVLLGSGFYFAYFRQEECEPGSACEQRDAKARRTNRAVLWLATLGAIAFAGFPYYVADLPAAEGTAAGATSIAEAQNISLPIEGMTCEGCATTLQLALQKTPGVLGATVNFENARADLVLDPDATPTQDILSQVIQNSGYKLVDIPD